MASETDELKAKESAASKLADVSRRKLEEPPENVESLVPDTEIEGDGGYVGNEDASPQFYGPDEAPVRQKGLGEVMQEANQEPEQSPENRPISAQPDTQPTPKDGMTPAPSAPRKTTGYPNYHAGRPGQPDQTPADPGGDFQVSPRDAAAASPMPAPSAIVPAIQPTPQAPVQQASVQPAPATVPAPAPTAKPAPNGSKPKTDTPPADARETAVNPASNGGHAASSAPPPSAQTPSHAVYPPARIAHTNRPATYQPDYSSVPPSQIDPTTRGRKLPWTTKALIWLAGADDEKLAHCPKWEVRKYAAFGATVLVPSTFGAIAASYAVSTVTPEGFKWVAFAFAIIWGLIILTIDRALLSSYRAFASPGTKLSQFLL